MINATSGTPDLNHTTAPTSATEVASSPSLTTTTTTTSTTTAAPSAAPKAPTPKKGKMPLRMIVGLLVVGLTIVGAAAGFYLTQQSQDIAPRASTASCEWCEGTASNWGSCPHQPSADSSCSAGYCCIPKTQQPPGDGGGTDPNLCDNDAQTASACRNVAPGTNVGPCTCQRTTGTLCACVSNTTCAGSGGACYDSPNGTCSGIGRSVANGGAGCPGQVCCGGTTGGGDNPGTASCNFNGTTVVHGQSVCSNDNEFKTCNNGTLNTTICSTGQECRGGKCQTSQATSCSYSYGGGSGTIPDGQSICLNDDRFITCTSAATNTTATTICPSGQLCSSGKCIADTGTGGGISCSYTPPSGGTPITWANGTSVCVNDNVSLGCQNGVYLINACAAGTTCTNGLCKPGVTGGSNPCTIGTTSFASGSQICTNDNQYAVCTDGKYTINTCAAGQECRANKCTTISTTNTSCMITGKIVASGASICTSTNSYGSCDNGTSSISVCPANSTCVGGKCITSGGDNPPNSSTCYNGSPTALSCRGNAVNSRCTGYAGTCRATGTNTAGNTLCGCIPDQQVSDNGSCTDDSNCASGYCRKTQTPFVCRPASERPGSGGGTTTNACRNDSNLTVRRYLKFTCPNGCIQTTEGGVTAWRCYENREESTSPLSLNGACGQVDQLSGDSDSTYCGLQDYTCDQARCQGGGSSPTPSATPTTPPTNPPGPMCLSITLINMTRPNQSPIRGDALRFTCGEVTGATSYVFRVIEPDKNIFTLHATGASSSTFNVTQSGRHYAQCQFCTGSGNSLNCQPYESYGNSSNQ